VGLTSANLGKNFFERMVFVVKLLDFRPALEVVLCSYSVAAKARLTK